MSIEYVEIRNASGNIQGIIDTANSIIWHSVYYGVGDFEIYAQATERHLALLIPGNLVTRVDVDEVGIIENINISYNAQNGRVITATGRFAKSILDRRCIYKLSGNKNVPTVLNGNVEIAVRKLVSDNAINCTFDTRRNIPELELGALANIPAVIVASDDADAQKQANNAALLDYSDAVLTEYELSAKVILNRATGKLQYIVYAGIDRSIGNAGGNDAVIFSQELDNLTGSEYANDTAAKKTTALIGGGGEGIDRFYSVMTGSQTGLDRREMFVDGNSISQTLTASELQAVFTTGVFTGIYFTVGGTIYATLETDLTKEYSLSQLQELFPGGEVSGNLFAVGGVTYARRIFGETDKYTLTPIGYKGMLDAEGEEGDYTVTATVYSAMLNTYGKQEIAQYTNVESFSGTIDITNGQWELNVDFKLGDIITIQDIDLGKTAKTRVTETLETQDGNGYSVEAVYN